MKKIEAILEQYGLNEHEVKAYIGLLKRGPSTILELSKYVKLNRSTTHVAVANLINKGVVSQTSFGERRLVLAEEPERLSILLENEKRELKRKEDIFKDLVSSIYDVVSDVKETTSAQVKYYEGHKSIAKVYDEILMHNEIRAYYQPSILLENGFPENVEKFLNAGKKGHLELWDIQPKTNLDAVQMEMYSIIPKYHFKFFPEGIHFNAMDYLIYEDHIAIVNFDERRKKPICIVIENRLVYENAKVLFDLMWKLLPD